MNSKKIILIGLVIILMGMNEVQIFGQDANLSFFSELTGKKREKGLPIRITADSMDININNNTAVFKDNVFVDDQDVKINCNQMIIQLKQDPVNKNKKVMDTITCLGNVVVLRKLYDLNEIAKGEQRADAGKAVWNIEKAMIVLTEKPILYRGTNKLKGKIIEFDLNGGIMKVAKGDLELREDKLKSLNNEN